MRAAASALLPCCVLAGCGGQTSDIVKVVVEGTVTLDGVPVPNGEVRFYPKDGTRGPVSGGPVRDGQYIANGRGGVPVGRHAVEILAFRPDPKAKAGPEGGPVEQYLPARYNKESELTADVSGERDPDTVNFELTSR